MNERINFPLAKLAASELFEALVAAQYDTKHSGIHRETVERQFYDLAIELGISVDRVAAPALEAAE